MTAAAWRVERYAASDPVARREVERLVAEGVAVCDTLAEQLRELALVDAPWLRATPDGVAARVTELAAGRTPAELGVWIHYPWARRLVRVLDEGDFLLVRLDRNRQKITREEQGVLRSRSIAIAGLSVGAAVARTLALEGVGGRFRLADFDDLSLSNLNRLFAGVHEIGVPKVVLAARHLLELDPFLEIEVFPDGITRDNVDAFLGGADLLVEECDDLPAKVFLRERARELGLPVVMETNDRCLLDIERFDREPARPLLHGLLGDLGSHDLATLPPGRRMEVIRALVPEPSERLVRSMAEMGRVLGSWPQLASSVVLGGAVVTDVVRRIFLGEHTASGRYAIDLAALIAT